MSLFCGCKPFSGINDQLLANQKGFLLFRDIKKNSQQNIFDAFPSVPSDICRLRSTFNKEHAFPFHLAHFTVKSAKPKVLAFSIAGI